MKKYTVTAVLLLLCILLTGCSAAEAPIEFPQKTLPGPDHITIRNASAEVTYEKDSAEYQKLVEAFSASWWLTAKDEPDTAPADALIPATGPRSLKTVNENRTYTTSSDTFLCFVYEKAPITWVQDNGKAIEIRQITFLLPEKTDTQDHVRGSFTVSETASFGYNEGWFTYYYPAEIANSFWDWLLH